METRSVGTTVSTNNGKIVGTASVVYDGTAGTEYKLWDDPPTYERFAAGAFDNHLAARPDVVITANHSPHHVIARTASGTAKVWSDARGLHYEATPRTSPQMEELRSAIEHGDYGGSSIRFQADKVEWVRDGQKEIRLIKQAKVGECGPVVEPAYGASTVGLRSAERSELERERDDYRAMLETEKRIKKLESLTK